MLIDRRVGHLPRRAASPSLAPRVRTSGTRVALERIAWLALLPIYALMAVVLTAGYAIAVLVVAARSWGSAGR
jgi:hypothetical protein